MLALKELIGQAIIISFAMLIIAGIICKLLEDYKELKRLRQKEQQRKNAEQQKNVIAQHKQQEFIRKENIRICQKCYSI